MKKYTSEDSYYARMNSLAGVKKGQVNESDTRNMGTLIDIERAANGVAYGIVKEQHKYYIKKGGLNENQDVADFAYIGGHANSTDYEYTKLAEAQKNRNMMLKTINEGLEVKPMESVGKKTMIMEGEVEAEIKQADSKMPDLQAATDAADAPPPAPEPAPEVPADDGAAEMDAGLEAMDAPAETDPLAGAEDAVDPLAGDDAPVDDMGTGEMGSGEGEDQAEEEGSTPLQKKVSKVAKEIQTTDLQSSETKWLIDRFLRGFLPVKGVSEGEEEVAIEEPAPEAEVAPEVPAEEPAMEPDAAPEADTGDANKMADLEIEDRQELADMILNVVPEKEIEGLGQSVEDAEGIPAPEDEVAEQQCAECGGFAQYAESRGYDVDSIKECGEEEMTNMISGYANAHGEGQNDGDFKAIALFITPEIIEKLKGDYGHDDFANQVEPFSNEMNETTAEDKEAQINELFGGLKNLGRAAGQGIKQGAQAVGQAVSDKAQQVGQAVQQGATAVKQTYHAGEVPKEVKKLEAVAADLGKQIDSLNKRLGKAGKDQVNVRSIISTIQNQIAGGGAANLGSKIQEEESIAIEEPVDGTGIEKTVNEEGLPVDSTEVMPPMEEDVNITVSEKKGKPLSAEKAPEVEMKESEEKEGDDIEVADLEGAADDAPVEVPAGEEEPLDLTKREEPEMPIISGVDAMGGGVVKPEGAEVTTVEVTKDSVKVEMNEQEAKLRKYIRNRLEEKAGLKKPSLNETKKSATLQKLDKTIDKQFELFESIAMDEVFGWSMKEKFQKLDPSDAAGIEALFGKAFSDILINPKMAAVGKIAQTTAPEEKYALLQQYVEGGGGSLRTDGNAVEGWSLAFVPKETKDAATQSPFASPANRSRLGQG